ncbi:MAG TPA: diacylglycerol kinase family protein [Kofleriaceae bacterium]|nr:diacylglycerol kinase family protein [Kofleriaceae bacterium]
MEARLTEERRRVTDRRARQDKREAQVVLICNPRAGGRWKALAGILDSEEARHVRRIVTDSVEDIAQAVADLGEEAELLCIYGGDGTIQRILDRLAPRAREQVHLALLGGGTMNVTSRWCGFSRDPVRNFRYVVRGHRTGELLYKEVPILEVTAGGGFHRGFTFGMGPVVRLLDAYERGRKGKVAALRLAAQAIAAAWIKSPQEYEKLLTAQVADIQVDGEKLPYSEFAAVFANVTGQINPGVEPFVNERSRNAFYCAAAAVSARELSLAMPFLVRGWLPLDLAALTEPGRLLERLRNPALFTDPRYINRTGSRLEIRTEEPLYTLDGEIIQSTAGELAIELGPTLRLAVGAGPRRPSRLKERLSRVSSR